TLPVLLARVGRAAEVEDAVGAAQQVTHTGPVAAVPGVGEPVPVRPALGEAVSAHHFGEVREVAGGARADPAAHGIVGRRARILDVPDVAAERPQTHEVVDGLPGHAGEWILPGDAEHDDP